MPADRDRASSVAFTLDGEVGVRINVRNWDAIERIAGPGGDEWRGQFYGGLRSKSDVLAHFAYNAVANGVEDASRLEGWADLDLGDVTMSVESAGWWTVTDA